MKTEKFFVQETIGGWRQNAVFEGTIEECQKFVAERCTNGSYTIVHEDDYKVDYL